MLKKLLLTASLLCFATTAFAATGVVFDSQKSVQLYLVTVKSCDNKDYTILSTTDFKTGNVIEFDSKQVKELYTQSGQKLTVTIPPEIKVIMK